VGHGGGWLFGCKVGLPACIVVCWSLMGWLGCRVGVGVAVDLARVGQWG